MFRLLRPILDNKLRPAGVFRELRTTQSISHLNTQVGYERNIIESRYGPVNIPKMCLTDYIFEECEKVADKPALSCGSSKRSYNYGMLYEMTRRMARALLSQKGCAMRKKEVVGILLPNIPEYVPALHGSLLAGLVVTFANPLYTPEEICRQFENADVRLVITLPVLLPVAQVYRSKAKKYKGTVCIGGKHNLDENVFGFEQLLREDHRSELPEIDPEDTAILPYSSGTTGMPKGVELSHNNLVANLAQGSHPEMNKYYRPEFAGYTETVLTIPPFFHIYGLNGILNVSLKTRNHLVSIPRFIPEDYLQCLVEFRPKLLFVVPSLMLFLATHPKVTPDHLSSVESVLVGAAAASIQLQDKFKQKCGKDVDITQGYGMTESSPVTLCTPYKYDLSKVGTCGQLYPNTQAKIVSLTDGSNLGPHQTGELYLRGPQVMKGYLNNVKATSETLDSEGWLHTGDVAYYDSDGFFYIVDRTKELIKVKGNQVSPTELENLILELPEVSDVAVAGIADETSGELPRAYVVLKPDKTLDSAVIVNHVKERVVKYKQLAGGVMFVKEIPRNAGGKVLRHQLHLLGAQLDD
ncbi:probable 4-coumarate--CoA ligase 1 [Toxorhynchites rutilus septentrionalis]|uniref:probable 4-coumarate--CoA ligase 1 n=1 Tax=Toxorhynchites rutilus septentrionalis TaxID=329112 RepID=UPI00247A161C|nr:probable 4-coumarate--CoA ligase 1 [Toxorhynchites rutilus septentrionalis]